MKTTHYIYSVLAVAGAMLIGACSQPRNGWTIEGNIAGANDSTLFVEEPSGAAWIIIDSVKTDGAGNFSFTAVNPLHGNQSIMRVRMGDKSVYFPVENAETITLTADADNMGRMHSLTGSAAAMAFASVDSLIAVKVDALGADKTVTDADLLQRLGKIILNDTTNIVSYYVIKHPVENRMMFTPDNKLKIKLIGAAATKYQTQRPDDPRAYELAQMFTAARQAAGLSKNNGQTMTAVSVGRPALDFVGKDAKGNAFDLNEVLDRGGVTVVNLICYVNQLAGANTAALGEAYDKYKGRGLEIYQIGFDANEAYWRQNASTMPWIAVYSPDDVTTAEMLMTYNANPMEGGPVSLVFNKQGELVARVTNPQELEKVLSTLF